LQWEGTDTVNNKYFQLEMKHISPTNFFNGKNGVLYDSEGCTIPCRLDTGTPPWRVGYEFPIQLGIQGRADTDTDDEEQEEVVEEKESDVTYDDEDDNNDQKPPAKKMLPLPSLPTADDDRKPPALFKQQQLHQSPRILGRPRPSSGDLPNPMKSVDGHKNTSSNERKPLPAPKRHCHQVMPMIEPQSTTRDNKKPELIYDNEAFPVKGMNLTGWKQKIYRCMVCRPNCIAMMIDWSLTMFWFHMHFTLIIIERIKVRNNG
jgi:hypothetical protein